MLENEEHCHTVSCNLFPVLVKPFENLERNLYLICEDITLKEEILIEHVRRKL